MRSQVDHRQVSGEMCRAELPGGNQFQASERSTTPAMKALYGTRCGHGEKAERDFDAHRIDEDGF